MQVSGVKELKVLGSVVVVQGGTEAKEWARRADLEGPLRELSEDTWCPGCGATCPDDEIVLVV